MNRIIVLPWILILTASPLIADGKKDVEDAKQAIQQLSKGRLDGGPAPKTGVFNEWEIEVSTFDTGIEVPTLHELMNLTVRKMESLWPGKMKTYYREDQFGYHALKVIVVFDPPLSDLGVTSLEVGFSESNDHSTYYFATSRSDFDSKHWIEIPNGELSLKRLEEGHLAWKAKPEKPR